jgi:integrase/recombinase XerD
VDGDGILSVQQRGDKWTIRVRPDGRSGPQKRITLPEWIRTREDAEEWERHYRPAPATPSLGASLTVKTLYPRYLEDDVRLYQAAGTHTDMSSVFDNHIDRILGALGVDEITDGMIVIYIKTRKGETSARKKRPVSNRTVNKELSYLAAFLTWCRDKGHMSPADSLRIRYLPCVRPTPMVLTFEEAADFLVAAEPFYRALFGCMYGLGVRSNEGRSLSWEDIDLSKRYAIITNTKTGNPRIIPIPIWLAAFLLEIKPPEGKGQVFLRPFTGKRAKREGRPNSGKPVRDVRKAIERARQGAQILKKITPHLLRHTFATHAVDLDVNLFKIRDILGHAKISTTEWYTHVAAEFLRGAQNTMDDHFSRVLKGRAPRDPVKTAIEKESGHTLPK